MRSQKILMITTTYPYGHGESFVKSELEHISQFLDVELVPLSFTAGVGPRQVKQAVNLDYAEKRWGPYRKFHVLSSFAKALWNYRWLGDLVHILRRRHVGENTKELARALYRAQLFQNFLKHQVLKHSKQFDLIYFYWMLPEIMGAIAFRRASKLPLKIVARAHGGDLYADRKAGGYIGLRNSIAAGVDEIYCISRHGKAYLDKSYPAMKEKFHVARLGVDDPGYLNAQPAAERLSIVSCSFFVAEKRLHLIVAAIEYLLNSDPGLKIKWTHIGDGELYEQIRTCVARSIEGRAEVVFTGYLTQDQLADLYRDEGFDVVVNVSDREGIPVSLMEASSVGIPMVATDVGGNSEIVNAANGVLIPADSDIEAIASALIRFKDKKSSAAYREQARASWAERFNAQANYQIFGQGLQRMAQCPVDA